MDIISVLLSFGLLMIAMTIHEFAHGFTAYKLGDPTAKYSGRLTLNPMAHIDIIWTILLPLFLIATTRGQFVFGMAKPVPVNFYALHNPKRDMALVGVSGPLANFILAVLLALFSKLLPLNPAIKLLATQLILINLILGVFNLIPIPPLDGSRILMGILPGGLAYKYSAIEPFGFIFVILLVALGLFDILIWPIITFLMGILMVPF